MPKILGTKTNQVPLVLGFSLVSLLVSFFDIGKLPLDAAWAAIVLCGLPIRARGVKTILLTGDATFAAEHVAQAAGISDVKAHCLPEDKLSEIRRYQEQGEPICMVGDGINDAPALKAASVGIAMGGVGSDIAIDAADIVLVRDDIQEIPALLSLSKRIMRTIDINIAASLLLNFASIVLAISGVLNPILGALVHNAGSVAVIANSSLLLTWNQHSEKKVSRQTQTSQAS